MPATGSLDGDLAAARQRRPAKATRRTRKAYRITARGEARFAELLLADDAAGDDERTFALKLAFCRHLDPDARLELLHAPSRRARRPPGARPARLARTRATATPGPCSSTGHSPPNETSSGSTQLIAAEGRDDGADPCNPHPRHEGATAS